jgi:hypothetical protein
VYKLAIFIFNFSIMLRRGGKVRSGEGSVGKNKEQRGARGGKERKKMKNGKEGGQGEGRRVGR